VGKALLTLLLMASPTVHAGWWASFCDKVLTRPWIAEDPYPFAEHDFHDLLEVYMRTHSQRVLTEIVYRVRAGMLTADEQHLFWEYFR
jgi:hypothetical protein